MGPASSAPGLSLAPMRAARFDATNGELARLISPPYDVINDAQRAQLLADDRRNIVGLILPDAGADGRPDYVGAARRLERQRADGTIIVDDEPALYVYEMSAPSQGTTRGLLGAVRLHDASDGVIFPHENTMAGPVADRLALMEATQANLEPIYLLYDGGGAASRAVAFAALAPPLAEATSQDGVTHRLWRITDEATLHLVATDLGSRTAVIADGHHRYATYLELQRTARAKRGAGPWDRGLALLVDTSSYGPSAEAIHRVVPGLELATAMEAARAGFEVTTAPAWTRDAGGTGQLLLDLLHATPAGFAALITDGDHAAIVRSPTSRILSEVFGTRAHDPVECLDVTIVHDVLVAALWNRPDTEDALRYAHSAADAVAQARETKGVAILLRPTPVESILAIARSGLRMPRKSTLFTPKPASGIALRLFADQAEDR